MGDNDGSAGGETKPPTQLLHEYTSPNDPERGRARYIFEAGDQPHHTEKLVAYQKISTIP